ncbi:hypothetical protein EX30DRAFT_219825 [Ascodesmis nigricans]|uniref:CENP-V/GFA domain-containing protein n=1 Tax=Ascodesmis nigricans TaxID=341454 RepID=A0A4S2MZP2_9PEZI|nr:hypothetical protein EX30DRAFT_219825 [Ascodesmis nigricans]
MTWTTPIRGHCFCNGCSYTIDPTLSIPLETKQHFKGRPGETLYFECLHDHCTSCRRASSNLSVPWLIFPPQWLSWAPGSSEHLKTFKSSNGDVERQFCGTCGTSFSYFRHSRNLVIDINMATLSDRDLEKIEELGLVPKRHGSWSFGFKWWQKTFVDAAKASGEVLQAWKGSSSDPKGRVEF